MLLAQNVKESPPKNVKSGAVNEVSDRLSPTMRADPIKASNDMLREGSSALVETSTPPTIETAERITSVNTELLNT